MRSINTWKYWNSLFAFPLVPHGQVKTWNSSADNSCFKSESDRHIVICWELVSTVSEGGAAKNQASSRVFSSNRGRSYSTVCGAVDASVCAVMWSGHASVLRKYVTFHLRDAARCKAAAGLPGSLREEESAGACQVTNQRLEEVVIMVPCPVWLQGFGKKWFRKERWVTTRGRVDEFHLTVLKKMWLGCNECGSLLCSCCSTPVFTLWVCVCQRFHLHYRHRRGLYLMSCLTQQFSITFSGNLKE